eukprot:8987501-Alexandrium_andersonii.AAC.1
MPGWPLGLLQHLRNTRLAWLGGSFCAASSTLGRAPADVADAPRVTLKNLEFLSVVGRLPWQ